MDNYYRSGSSSGILMLSSSMVGNGWFSSANGTAAAALVTAGLADAAVCAVSRDISSSKLPRSILGKSSSTDSDSDSDSSSSSFSAWQSHASSAAAAAAGP